MLYFKLGGLLLLFWFLLSGHTSALLMALGLASVILVVWLMGRMDRTDQAPSKMVFSLQFIRYMGWLLWQVVIANFDVARRILDPSMPIQPAWRKINVGLKKPLYKTIYANSITLTPGTVTTYVGEDYFIVHALDASGIDDLNKGEMESRLLQMEQNS